MDFDCEGANLRARLKHSWLENQVLNKTPSDVLDLRSYGFWHALESQFPARIREAGILADGVDQAFSPAQLVERLAPFDHLDDRRRKLVLHAAHRAYLAESGIEGHAPHLI